MDIIDLFVAEKARRFFARILRRTRYANTVWFVYRAYNLIK